MISYTNLLSSTIKNEVRWLIAAGDAPKLLRLVENLGWNLGRAFTAVRYMRFCSSALLFRSLYLEQSSYKYATLYTMGLRRVVPQRCFLAWKVSTTHCILRGRHGSPYRTQLIFGTQDRKLVNKTRKTDWTTWDPAFQKLTLLFHATPPDRCAHPPSIDVFGGCKCTKGVSTLKS